MKIKLLASFEKLNDTDQSSVVSFAQFLVSQAPQHEELLFEKRLEILRPDEESVVAAIKRLAKTYPMVNQSDVMDKCAQLMSEHMLKGKDATSVINELEVVFTEQYVHYEKSFESK